MFVCERVCVCVGVFLCLIYASVCKNVLAFEALDMMRLKVVQTVFIGSLMYKGSMYWALQL